MILSFGTPKSDSSDLDLKKLGFSDFDLIRNDCDTGRKTILLT